MDSALEGRGMERREAEVEQMSMSDSVSSFTLSVVSEQGKCKNERQPAVQGMLQHTFRPNHGNHMLIYSELGQGIHIFGPKMLHTCSNLM